MNKAELIDAITKVTSLSKSDTEHTLEALMEVVAKNIKSKDGIRLVGFGTFTISHRNARTGRNPQTGAEMAIPARDVPVFRPGKQLRDAAN